MIFIDFFTIKSYYTHGKKLGDTSCVTRVNFGLNVFYNVNMY